MQSQRSTKNQWGHVRLTCCVAISGPPVPSKNAFVHLFEWSRPRQCACAARVEALESCIRLLLFDEAL